MPGGEGAGAGGAGAGAATGPATVEVANAQLQIGHAQRLHSKRGMASCLMQTNDIENAAAVVAASAATADVATWQAAGRGACGT